MIKLSTITGFLALIILVSSCARILRPGGQNKGGNNNNNTSNNTPAPNNITALKNIVFSKAVNVNGINQALALDVYQPPNPEGKKFPAIFLIHGGGFTNGDKNTLASTAAKLAANGYVVISLNYRVGFGKVNTKSLCADTNILKKAIYRAVQDAYSAINFITQKANTYNIDKDWVFVGGASAGAITALSAAYLQRLSADIFFPGLPPEMGALNGNTKNNFTVRGIISMWGAFTDPQFITAKNALPTIFFQGELDNVVPFKSRPFAPCPAATPIYGTYPLYNRLKDLGVTAIAHVDPQGGHGVFTEDFRVQNILCFLNDVRQGITKQVYLTGVQSSCDK